MVAALEDEWLDNTTVADAALQTDAAAAMLREHCSEADSRRVPDADAADGGGSYPAGSAGGGERDGRYRAAAWRVAWRAVTRGPGC